MEIYLFFCYTNYRIWVMIMVFRKPYAFFIKYFRLINLVLVLLMVYFGYKMNLLHQAVNDIYLGTLTNYSNLDASYIGFTMYLLLFLISIFIIVIIMTLKRKDKPFKDYLFNMIYNVFIVAYFLAMSNLFLTLNETVVEITDLKLYSDISLLIIVPLLYFIVKYILIVIGFDLKKFNFAKDIVEMKQSEEDNEEVEVIFDKNTYKVKRGIRRYFRELKYYALENKMFISIIVSIVLLIGLVTLFSVNIFNSNKVSRNETFTAGNFSYKVTDIYETQYDSNYNLIKDDSKFVIISVNVRNLNSLGSSIDFKRIRVMYGDEYSYASNYYNKYFYDLGKPYNNEVLKSGENYNYIFIFKVPSSYKSNKYELKFYDKLTVQNDETVGNYKELKCSATKLDKDRSIKEVNLNENTVFNKKRYGESNITVNGYNISSSYVYNNGEKTVVVRDKDINNVLLILDYKLNIDKEYPIYSYFDNDKDFFSNFVSIEYIYNGKERVYDSVLALDVVDGKVMLSVPFQVKDASSISFVLNFRDTKVVYKLK